jgi:hypothetical protein
MGRSCIRRNTLEILFRKNFPELIQGYEISGNFTGLNWRPLTLKLGVLTTILRKHTYLSISHVKPRVLQNSVRYGGKCLI